MNNTAIISSLLFLTSFVIIMKKASFSKIVANQKFRGCDARGCGEFGTKRSHGKHNGLDVITIPGEAIYSPIDGTVTRFPFPYADNSNYTGIEIKNTKYDVKMFYLAAHVPAGTIVKKNQPIAKAQNIAALYPGMTNHVHIEVRDKSGKLINPITLF